MVLGTLYKMYKLEQFDGSTTRYYSAQPQTEGFTSLNPLKYSTYDSTYQNAPIDNGDARMIQNQDTHSK
jgi:hypothetical protein